MMKPLQNQPDSMEVFFISRSVRYLTPGLFEIDENRVYHFVGIFKDPKETYQRFFRQFVTHTRLLEMFIIQNVEYTLHKLHSRDFVPVKGYTMEETKKMRTPAIYYYCLAALCVVSLFIGMAHAADPTTVEINTTKGFGYRHPPMPQLNISGLEQQGVTMADVKAARERNDTASIRAWRDASRQPQKGITGNVTPLKQQKLITGIAPFERNGTKVFPARNLSMQSTIKGMAPGSFGGNMTHKSPAANSTLFLQGPVSNGTIMRHALDGTDINQKKPTHLNGNNTAMKPWSGQYNRTHAGDQPKGLSSRQTAAVTPAQS